VKSPIVVNFWHVVVVLCKEMMTIIALKRIHFTGLFGLTVNGYGAVL